MVKNIIYKEFKGYFRNLNSIFLPLIFFFLIISIFPLLVGPDKNLLNKIIPGIVWITIIFTTVLSSNNFFKDEYNDGFIETYLTSDTSIELILFFKILLCWIFTCLPIIFFIPIVSIFFDIPLKNSFVILFTLIVGSPILVSIGIFGSSLTLGMSKNNVLAPVITLPFYIPILIFSASAIESVSSGLPYEMQLYILIALLFFILPIMPYLLKYTLTLSINN